MPILENVRRTIQQNRLILQNSRLVIGVSGGADSLVLMHILARLQAVFQFTPYIVTLDHGWRGAQSAAEAQFVVEMAQSLDLPVFSKKLEWDQITGNAEAAGRRARYDYFAEIARQVGAEAVAVGHHADDQSETILMHILRGSGTFRGMGWKSELPYHRELHLIRPLLGVNRDEIEAYCQYHQLEPRHDPTNNDLNFLRNRIRHEVLPNLSQINPAISHVLVNFADVAAVEADYLAQETAKIVETHAIKKNHRWVFPLGTFKTIHPALQRQLIRKLAASLFETHDVDLSYQHVIAAQRICVYGEHGTISQFTSGLQVRVEYDRLIFENTKHSVDYPEIWIEPDYTVKFKLEESVTLGSGFLQITRNPQADNILGKIYLPSLASLTMRTRQPGDKVALPGLDGHTQKLKEWMINRKIPAHHRSRVPLLLIDDIIISIIHSSICFIAHPFQQDHNATLAYWIVWKLRN